MQSFGPKIQRKMTIDIFDLFNICDIKIMYKNIVYYIVIKINITLL